MLYIDANISMYNLSIRNSDDGRRVVPIPLNKTAPVDLIAQAGPTVIKCRCWLPPLKTDQLWPIHSSVWTSYTYRRYHRKKMVSAPKRKADNSDIEIIVIDGKQDSANKEKVELATSKKWLRNWQRRNANCFQWGDNHTQCDGLRNQSLRWISI